jgi:hypothetical protein
MRGGHSAVSPVVTVGGSNALFGDWSGIDESFAIKGDEIHDVPVDGMLTPKFPVSELAVAQDSP